MNLITFVAHPPPPIQRQTCLLIFEIISGYADKKRNGATAFVRHQIRYAIQIQPIRL